MKDEIWSACKSTSWNDELLSDTEKVEPQNKKNVVEKDEDEIGERWLWLWDDSINQNTPLVGPTNLGSVPAMIDVQYLQ